ncbi:MAG: phosphoribosylanthranilate isomerase [Caldimicrobium sp.]
MSVKVKICGLTRAEDIHIIESYPVDYLGFIMYPPSPRYVGKDLKHLLSFPKKTKKVVVFVNPSYEEVKRALDFGADLIQLHGEESPELAKKIGLNKIIKALRIKNELNLEELRIWKDCYALLLDTYKRGVPGGTGETFNWEWARLTVNAGYRIFLAGGITPENVLLAIEKVKPYAIDLSSGIEKSPGVKDPAKVKLLFERLKVVRPTTTGS